MRLRLFHKLALVTTLLMALTIVALASVMIRNLRYGFNSYLDERDQEQLRVFAGVVSEAIERTTTTVGQDAIAALDMHSLLEEQANRENVAGRHRFPQGQPKLPSELPQPGNRASIRRDRYSMPPSQKGPADVQQNGSPDGPPNEMASDGGEPDFDAPPDGPPPGMRPAGPPGPPPGRNDEVSAGVPLQNQGRQPDRLAPNRASSTSIDSQPAAALQRPPRLEIDLPGRGFGARVSVRSPTGQVLAGPSFASEQQVLEEPVLSSTGKLLAKVQLAKVTRASEGLDERFLNHQILAIVIVSGVAFMLAMIAILLLSRRLAEPLRAAQSATARIASGDFSTRLLEHGSDEVADLVRNINAMARSLATLENARKNWLAQLSHELRTPLTVLQGECEAMIDRIRPISMDAIVGLHERALALNRIVADLHTVSLSDLGALPHIFERMDARELIDHVLCTARSRFADAELTAMFADPPTEMHVCWDAGRITQLLENLLGNSLRYTDAPGQVQVRLIEESGWVTLRWEDSAPGVAADLLDQLFEPLYRANPERSRKQGGSGLGLAVCRAIVQAHRGTIRAQASPMGGVCILIVLPVDPGAS